MDRIDASILKGMHVTNNPNLLGKTWKDFEIACKNKRLIIYGISKVVNLMWIRCKTDFFIIAAIDNDAQKQGHLLNEFFDEEDINSSEKVKIFSKEALNDYDPTSVVILISSQRYYEEIASELDEQHFHCYFSILNLEYNYRKYMKENNFPFEDERTHINNYAKECIKKYPIQNNKVIFYGTGNYSDHGKYITEQLLKMNKNLDIVWIINRSSINVPKGIRTIYEGKWKQYVYEMETAKIWIYGVPVRRIYPIKRKEQFYIQMKHWGSITLKKFYLDDPLAKNAEESLLKLNGELIDYIISGSEFDEASCRSGFGFNGKFLRFGSPRSDILFNQKKYKEKIYSYYNISKDDQILIYAPTFRNHNVKKFFYDFKWQDLNFNILLDSLKKRWQGKWKIFLRLHPTVKFKSKQIKQPDYVIDVSDYEDSQELVAASDVMISDYSSIAFEPAYVMKPVFLYAPDKDDYQRNDRGLLLNYDSLPFPISTTNEELSNQIINFDEVKYKRNVKDFFDKYDVHEDGHASERAAKFIVDLIEK